VKFMRWIALVCCAMPLSAYAIFCPTNGTYLELGDTAESARKLCGAPTTVNTIDNSIILSAIWTYVKDTDDATITTKLTIDKVQISGMTQSITCKTTDGGCYPVIDQPIIIFEVGCAQQMYIGNNIPWIERFCGPPKSKETLKADYHVTEEYVYANTTMPSTLIFENGKLIDSK